MIEFYSESFEPKQATVNRLIMFSKSITSVKSEILKEILIINLN